MIGGNTRLTNNTPAGEAKVRKPATRHLAVVYSPDDAMVLSPFCILVQVPPIVDSPVWRSLLGPQAHSSAQSFTTIH